MIDSTLLARFPIGTDIRSVEPATRSRHTVYKLSTNTGRFAVKVLAGKHAEWVARYEASERIAARLAETGVNAVAAIRSDVGTVVCEIDGTFHAVYPWIDGECRVPDRQSAAKIAELLAGIHNAELSDDSRASRHPPDFDLDLLSVMSRAADLRDLAAETNARLQKTRDSDEPVLLSHTDLHPENVLWRNGDPWILDWEEACMTWYSFDLVGTTMMWTGLRDGEFTLDRYLDFRRIYTAAYRGRHTCNDAFGYWTAMGWAFAWLAHNLRRIARDNDTGKHEEAANRAIDVILASHANLEHIVGSVSDF